MPRPPLSQSPAVLFRGEYVFRSINGTMAVIVPLLTSAVFAVLAAYIESLAAVRAAFAVGAIVFGGLGLWTLCAWIGNNRIRVELNEDGIVSGNRYWPWEKVRSFAGLRHSNGVCLAFTPRELTWGGCDLPTTPLLTEQQYVDLARELSRCVAVRFPDLEVAMYPLEPPAGA